MAVRKCAFLGLPSADHRLEYPLMVADRSGKVRDGKAALTREMAFQPEKAAFPLATGPSGYYDKLEPHLLKFLYTTESVRNRQSIVKSVRLVVLLNFALE